MSRVGEVENGLKSETETSITIQQSNNIRHMDENGNQLYKSRSTLSSSDRTLKTAHSNIRAMGDRINLPKLITVSLIKCDCVCTVRVFMIPGRSNEPLQAGP